MGANIGVDLGGCDDTVSRIIAGTQAGWTPRSPLGLRQWQRADLGVSLTGNLVDQWADQSGTGLHLTGVGVRRPTYALGITPAGGPAIRAAAAHDLVFSADVLGATNTIAIVCTPSSAANSYLVDSNPTGRACILSNFGAVAFEWLGSFVDRLTFNAGAVGWHSLLATQTDAGALNLYFDSLTPVVTKPVAANALAGVTITQMFSNNAFGNRATADCAEFARWTTVLSACHIKCWFEYCRRVHGTP